MSHELLSSPDPKGSKILNEKATATFGEKHYHVIDNSTRVQLQCLSGAWARVQITDPEWLRDVRGWVKRSVLVMPPKPGEVRIYTEEDVYWDKDLSKHKAVVLKGLNRIHQEDERCKNDMQPGSVSLSPSKSKPGKPVFFVQCGKDAAVVNVHFSPADVESKEPFSAPVHLDKSKAVDLCEQHAKQNAAHPSTVEFSRVMSLAINEHPNGRTTVQSKFTAKNSFNLEIEFNIRCLLDSSGFIEGSISEATN